MFKTVLLLLFFVSSFASAADYPDMVGVWKADLRVISSGSDQTARGGAVITEVKATVTIEHQDQESFLGRVRLNIMGKDEPSTRMWGAIRSNGKEALFVGSDGTRGPIWFMSPKSYEFCVAHSGKDGTMSAYCGVFTKQED